MKLQKQIDQLIAQQASEWIEVLKTGGERERAAFVEWLCESRKHVAEFLAMTVVDGELKESAFKDLLDKGQLLSRMSPAVTSLNTASTSSPPLRTRGPARFSRGPLAIAAAAG